MIWNQTSKPPSNIIHPCIIIYFHLFTISLSKPTNIGQESKKLAKRVPGRERFSTLSLLSKIRARQGQVYFLPRERFILEWGERSRLPPLYASQITITVFGTASEIPRELFRYCGKKGAESDMQECVFFSAARLVLR